MNRGAATPADERVAVGDATFTRLGVWREGHVGWLVFDRPDAGNAMDATMMDELEVAWAALDADRDVRVIVNTGNGNAFQTGLDVRQLASDRDALREQAKRTREFTLRFTSWHCGVRVPVIAAVNGTCAGGGLHFVADADIVVMSEDVCLIDPHVSVGQASVYETAGLVRKSPMEQVLRMALAGRHERIDAARAHQLGICSELVPPATLRARAAELARTVATNSPTAMSVTKRALWRGLELGLTDACIHGARDLVGMWGHPDQTEGPLAFGERRTPEWRPLADDAPRGPSPADVPSGGWPAERRLDIRTEPPDRPEASVDPTSFEHLIVERHGPVGWLINDRPDQLNAMNGAMRDEFAAAWLQLDADPDVKVIVHTGNGRAFQTGVDVTEIASDGVGMERYRQSLEDFDLHFTAWHQGVRKPVITAVNGICAGGGFHWVADADIVIAASDAEFFDPHVSIGQVVSLEAIGLLRRMPAEAVMRMAFVGRHERMSASRAHELGMLSEVVDPPERLRERAQELGETIARNSPSAMAATKRALWRALETGLTEACREGAGDLVGMWGHPDQTEGPAAFAERRDAVWEPLDAPRG